MACPCCNDQGDLVAVIEVAALPPLLPQLPSTSNCNGFITKLPALMRVLNPKPQVQRRSLAPYTRPSISLLNALWLHSRRTQVQRVLCNPGRRPEKVMIFAARAISNTVLHATAAAGEVSFDTVSKMVS